MVIRGVLVANTALDGFRHKPRLIAHRPAVSQAVRSYHSQSHVDQHGDLISPSHRNVRETMDLRGVLAQSPSARLNVGTYQEYRSSVFA